MKNCYLTVPQQAVLVQQVSIPRSVAAVPTQAAPQGVIQQQVQQHIQQHQQQQQILNAQVILSMMGFSSLGNPLLLLFLFYFITACKRKLNFFFVAVSGFFL